MSIIGASMLGSGGGRPIVAGTNTSIQDAANTTTHTVSLPNNISSGDLLIVNFSVDGTTAVTWPNGWTELIEEDNSDVTLSIAYRQADGSEGSTIAVTTDNSERSAHTAYRITGHVDPATQAPEVTFTTDTDGTPDPPINTPTGGSKAYLFIAVQGHDRVSTMSAVPTNYSNGISAQGAANSTGVGIGSAERLLEADTEDPGTFTISSSEVWVAATVAVHP